MQLPFPIWGESKGCFCASPGELLCRGLFSRAGRRHEWLCIPTTARSTRQKEGKVRRGEVFPQTHTPQPPFISGGYKDVLCLDQ